MGKKDRKMKNNYNLKTSFMKNNYENFASLPILHHYNFLNIFNCSQEAKKNSE